MWRDCVSLAMTRQKDDGLSAETSEAERCRRGTIRRFDYLLTLDLHRLESGKSGSADDSE
jgi:hypothetical protein